VTEAELEQLIHAHQAEIFRYLRYLGATDAAAEDLVQETFLGAYQAARRPDAADERACAAWLRAIARNQFLKHCRRMRRDPVKTSPQTLERAEAIWSQTFLRDGDGFDYVEALRRCLETIVDKERQVVDWFYAEELSRAETAQRAAMSEDGVKSLLQRVRSKLGNCIKRRLELENTR